MSTCHLVGQLPLREYYLLRRSHFGDMEKKISKICGFKAASPACRKTLCHVVTFLKHDANLVLDMDVYVMFLKALH